MIRTKFITEGHCPLIRNTNSRNLKFWFIDIIAEKIKEGEKQKNAMIQRKEEVGNRKKEKYFDYTLIYQKYQLYLFLKKIEEKGKKKKEK